MSSPLHGLNAADSFASVSHSADQLPADLAAQLDLWSTLNFSNIDDGFGGLSVGVGATPFALGGGSAPGTLDDLVRLGEEELSYGTVDPFQVAPQSSSSASPPPVKKARAAKTARIATPAAEDSEDDEPATPSDGKTPVTPAEDKRRRNTAASARFRAKKKEREAALEKKAKELEGRVSELERECEALRRENGWLKGLVVGVTQAGGDLSVGPVPGMPLSLSAPAAPVAASSTGSKRKRDRD